MLMPSQIIQKLESTIAESKVIEITSTEDVKEPDTEYEEAHRRKRKLKAINTFYASKRLALSKEKTDTSNVGKKETQTQMKLFKTLLLPSTSPMKGGPLSPLTVGSLSMAVKDLQLS